jgi:hypothetical protein
MRLLLKMTAAAPCSTAFADLDETTVQSVLLLVLSANAQLVAELPFHACNKV